VLIYGIILIHESRARGSGIPCLQRYLKINQKMHLNFSFQDVSAKVMSFSQHGTRAVCVLSANGAISNATLRQTATSGGTVTYKVCAYSQ
jgi:hypothetical protein